MNHFKEGNIKRLYMKNFLTYTEIEVNPGANLNIVFGPNGSGKSSILCAICIVLGGKPEYTGRGKDVKDYIKHGQDKAIVEIELFHDKRNIVIKRTINRNGKSIFYYQGRETSLKDVLEKVDKFGICINNLCQFLPQDRVSEFSKLNKIQLLHSTQRAIGEADLAEQHQTLCQRGKKVDEIVMQVTNLEEVLAAEKAKNNQLADQVEAVRIENHLDTTIKQLTGLRLLRLYTANRRKLKDEVEPVTAEFVRKVQKLNQDIAPMQKKDQEFQAKINSKRVFLRQLNNSFSKLELEGKRGEETFAQHYAEIENENADFQAYQRRCNQRIKEVSDLKHTIQSMEGHLELLDEINEQQLQSEVKLLTKNISMLSEKSSNLKRDINDNTYHLVAENNKKSQIDRSLRSLQDSKERRLKLLLQTNNQYDRDRFRSIYQAAGWIRENGDKFSGPIHGPLYTIIDLKRPEYAKYVENTVSKNDLIAFVCESKDDVNLLKKYADDHNWPLNIIHSGASSNEYLPSVPIEEIRRIGFEMYLKDVISAPTAVVSFLCSHYHIENIALAKKADFSSVPNALSCFFIGDDRYDKSRSKYDGAASTSITQLGPVFFLGINTNERDRDNVHNEMQAIVRRIEEIQRLKNELAQQDLNVEKELEVLRREKQEIQNKLQQKLQMVTKIVERKRQLARREEEVIDVSGAELKMKSRIKNIVGELVNMADKHSAIREEISTVTLKYFYASFELLSSEQEKRNSENSMEALQGQIVEAGDQLSQQRDREVQLKRNTRAYFNNLCDHLHCTVEDLKAPGSQLTQNLEEGHQEDTFEQIEQLLADTEARKECIISPSRTVIEEYNKRESAIMKIEAEINSKSLEIENFSKNLDEAKNQWLPKIEQLTEQISEHFSSFMRRLGCAGLVTLDKGANETDFAQYGLSIKVQFRDSEKLKELTAHQQSGGERSVSTALYLMSLQTLTSVPFRCVDEINQGMDSNNEHRMFNMLVETSTVDSASQYFFLTPKLLPNLPKNKRVKYLNIVNGTHVPAYKEWRAKTMLRNLRSSLEL